jgi:HNH endonuclease/AP2 domain
MAGPTADRVLRDLDYGRDSGEFRWRVTDGRKIAGAIAGHVRANGYRVVGIDGEAHYAHRLVWLVEHGEWARNVDHIDGDPLNNRITNLRACSHSQNLKNMRMHRDNSSGYKGVTWNKAHQRWHARICVDGKVKHIGAFRTPSECARAYDDAARRFHGEFARVNGVV